MLGRAEYQGACRAGFSQRVLPVVDPDLEARSIGQRMLMRTGSKSEVRLSAGRNQTGVVEAYVGEEGGE